MKTLHAIRAFVCRKPGWIVGAWAVAAVAVFATAPDLTALAAEGQANMLGRSAESRRAAEVVRKAWPDQTYGSLAVAVLHRPEGLTDADRAFAAELAGRFEKGDGRPRQVLRVMGPGSRPEVAAKLVSGDGTVLLVAVPLATAFVSPVTQEAVAWLQLQGRVGAGTAPPPGLEVRWTGDAVLGRDFMGAVQTSLDRAALATVVLLMIVLLVVYRSVWLALVPLSTIGISLIVARGVLAWMTTAGWDISSLVELFLVAVLFGSGTDFCLFVSWRFAENWDPADPAGAMIRTKESSTAALVTSAGTVIVGLALMGTTEFRLFSSTGPSVAVGLAITLLATLTLTPALLVMLAKWRPGAYKGLTAPSSGLWDRVGAAAMSRPLLSWAATLVLMTPLALLGLKTKMVQDLMTELPAAAPSARTFRLLSEKFDPGMLAPLTVVIESESDLRGSEGIALIDDLSRFLSRQSGLSEVRSATQPLGSPEPLNRARLGSRLAEVQGGLKKIAEGAEELQKGLNEGAAKLRAAIWLEGRTGLSVDGGKPPASPKAPPAESPRAPMLREALQAADGARQLAEGAALAGREVGAVLNDPVGREALDRLLVNKETVEAFPALEESFAAYITPDGHRARFDIEQSDRVFSEGAMDRVVALRAKLRTFLEGAEGPEVTAKVAGPNAENADVRALTRSDQLQSWFVVPIGVFLVLLIALRDPLACLNLVGTMLLTYAFAIGLTHLVFVNLLGAEGLDWKVAYFLFVLLVAVGVDYNVFLMARLAEEVELVGLRPGIVRAIGSTGGLITSAAAITACSFASFMTSPLGSLRQLGFALVVGITVDALLVRPLLVPCGHWLLHRGREARRIALARAEAAASATPTSNGQVGARPAYVTLGE